MNYDCSFRKDYNLQVPLLLVQKIDLDKHLNNQTGSNSITSVTIHQSLDTALPSEVSAN